MSRWAPSLLLSVLAGPLLAGEPTQEGLDFFEKRVRPILAGSCFQCHGPTKQKASLRLDRRDAAFRGGESGPVILPGQPNESRLVLAVRYTNVDLQMPPRGRLPEAAQADLEAWVRMGAPWPADAGVSAATAESLLPPFDLEKRRREHWAWSPLALPEPPAVRDASWPTDDLDRFILAKLEEKGLSPAPSATKSTLLRRLTQDLTGLPPDSSEADAFLRDDSPGAYEHLVDRLIDSPRFGEHWARRWLDLVRYSETLGHEFDFTVPHAWRYRDYVIAAFNADLPYDQLLTEHIAGDLLATPRRSVSGENESVKGTAFYWFGQQTHSPVDQRQQTADRIDNQIDVLTKTFLGLTVACARCHDHKFDAIPTKDYYALYGFLVSSSYTQAQVDPPDRILGKAEKLASLHQGLRAQLGLPVASPGPLPSRESDVVLGDFSRPGLDGWLPDGPAFSRGAESCGETVFSGSAELPEILAFRGGWANSAALSRRLQGALRSPGFTIRKRFFHALVAGRDSRVRIVIDGFNLICDPIYGALKQVLGNESAHWITVDLERWLGRRAYVELSDLDPPDLADAGRAGGYGPSGWIAASCVLLSDRSDPPGALAAGRTIERIPPATSGESLDQARSLWAEYRRVDESIPAPTFVPAMADGSGEDETVFLRGNPKTPGETAERRFLVALSGASQAPVGKGSGRLELVRRMLDPANPLVSRVIVNRIWHHLFGRGIVSTVDDFGALGQKPSHPELLDWLALGLRNDGWSLKRLIRRMVTSSAYRMSSAPSDARAEELDPENTLLHRMRLRRMEGEAIRDRILAVSGGLTWTSGGPPTPIHLTPFMEGRGRPGASGPLDGLRRRSIFLEVRRNFLSPMFLAFDTPLPASTTGRRLASNVPAQALILLNDPFVMAEARLWAQKALSEASLEPSKRLEGLYEQALGRGPTADEIRSSISFLTEQATAYGAPPENRLGSLDAWADLCHVIFNLKEFIFIN